MNIFDLLPVFASGEGGAGGGGGAPAIPNLISWLSKIFHGDVWHFLHTYENVVYAYVVIVILAVVMNRASRKRALLPGGLQNAVEMIVEGLENFFAGILGPKDAKRYTPFLGSLFIYIWCMNMFGLIPLMMSPTGHANGINTTAGLAICVFLYVQYIGITRNGLWGYIFHFMGSPKSVVEWCMVPLNLPIHIIGEFARPVSLALRLFGNITGEDVLLGVFVGLGVAVLAFMPITVVGVPLHLPFIFLALLTGTIQALVFALLSTVYIALSVPHAEEGH